MPPYVGGKFFFAKYLLRYINALHPKVYWEPFVGAANVIAGVRAPVRIGTDSNDLAIAYFNALKTGWLPPDHVSKEDYIYWKDYEAITQEDKAYKFLIGHAASFGGKFFAGFVAIGASDLLKTALRDRDKTKGITFSVSTYDTLKIPDSCDLIYCDPPYKDTTRCGKREPFDTEKFWGWCFDRKKDGLVVLVSELQAPPGVLSIHDFALEINLGHKGTRIEKLFRV
jgi:DNA adenine methylase